MAIAATAIWNVQASNGSDTQCGGSFDTSQTAGMDTTGSITSPNTSAPVLSSTNYTFQSTDVGARVYLPSQTAITSVYAGWYNIASVAAGAATLTATAGSATIKGNFQTNANVGVASAGTTLTSVTWTIDYSAQTQSGTGYSLSFSTAGPGAGSTGTIIAGAPAGGTVQLVGNGYVCTFGTNAVTGYFTIISVTSTTVTFDRAITTGAVISGTGFYGGPMASWGAASGQMIASQTMTIKAGSYTMTSTTVNIANGAVSLPAGVVGAYTRIIGYSATIGDYGTQPLLTASGVSGTWTMVITGNNCIVDNLSVNGASIATLGRGFNIGTGSLCYRCKAAGMTNSGFTGPNASFFDCQATTCSGNAAFLSGYLSYCVAFANTNVGFSHTNTGACVNCISEGNTGASSDGYQSTSASVSYINCTSYGNGRDGFRWAPASITYIFSVNCIAESNVGIGFNATGTGDGIRLFAPMTYNNTSNQIATNPGNIDYTNVFGWIQNTTGSFFVNAGTGNFGLNSTANQGALARAANFIGVFPGLASTTGYGDAGAVQSQNTGGSTGGLIPVNLSGGIRG